MSLYKRNSITSLLLTLSKTITSYKETRHATQDKKIRLLIKELKGRKLSENQYLSLQRHVLRFAWI